MRTDAHLQARIEMSARWDGEHDPALVEVVDAHLGACRTCRSALEGMSAARQTLRLQAAIAPPDLEPSIMQALATPVRRVRFDVRRERWSVALVAAAVSALLIAGSSLPWDQTSEHAGAAEVSTEIRHAARTLHSYRATFSLIEEGWHERIPRRTFTATVDVDAPEDLRVSIRDTTDYPSGAWPRNDVELAASSARWWIREPSTCPPDALPGCGVRGSETRALTSRVPFDGDTLPPTDIVVPLETLASSGGFDVVASETIGNREVYRLELDRLAATPLLDALQPGGSWVRFDPQDPATIWIDRSTWFPVRFVVEAADSSARFEARLLEMATSADIGRVPAHAMVVTDGGFREVELDPWWVPTNTAGLASYRSGRAGRATVVSWASGLTWLKTTRDRASRATAIASEEIAVGDGTGYYQPADDRGARRIDLFVDGYRYRVEGNVARQVLLDVASSMPVVGDALQGRPSGPPAWFRAPARLPVGYEPAVVVREPSAVSVYYRHPEIERAGYGIRVTLDRSRRTLAPSSEEFVLVEVNGHPARWSNERGELEWIANGYRAVAAPGLGLATAVRVAESWGEDEG